jgi:signal transduction histidine kinase
MDSDVISASTVLATTHQTEQQQSETSTDLSEASQVAFVQDIRRERLNFLWKVTLLGVIFAAWLLFVFAPENFSPVSLVVPVVVIGVASLATRWLLLHDYYVTATWSYAMGLIVSISLLVGMGETTQIMMPFVGVMIIFIIGFLMSIQNTLILLGISYLFMLFTPAVLYDYWPLALENLFAFLMMGIAAILSIQVSGELYGIAKWALDSYARERKTATQLHESRLELEKSLLKQKNLTMQLQRINEELDEARQSAEVAKKFRGQFLANMSHELRTPLNAIIGFSETMLTFPMMYSGVELPPEYRKDMNQIFNSGKHLLSIINDILDLSKIDVGRLEVDIQPVELEPIFKGLLSTAVGLVGGKPIELRRETPEELPMVSGDPLRVRQVLLNIYSNAAKFTESGHITMRLKAETERVLMSVEDTGPGIAPDEQDKIFEAFQQGKTGRKQQRAGSGLGLAICQQLVHLMGGDIWFETELGKGSVFTIALPRHYPNEAEWVEADTIVDNVNVVDPS